ncbi:class I SAM-dependent methyltransferase [Shewanella decolorationis]|uniref:class I SAM-dependent methyltransferase n=1 Tax=Shewanella decolorationis TaxID=256839 RepID=UPI0010573412|nr:class I SAM-dependent methyltransferase [Shewanella decolorationis]
MLQSNEVVNCAICQKCDWNILATLKSGIWDTNSIDISRININFHIGNCRNCNHVQIITPYTIDTFKILYFSNNAEPDMWCESSLENSPYAQMYEFINEYVRDGLHIADFGAGSGVTLKLINERVNNSTLTSIDFHDYTQSDSINHIKADLNNLSDISSYFKNNPIQIAISTHVLEHIVNPIEYLNNIAKYLDVGGLIFIEVPDCKPKLSVQNIASTNIVHGQHIHYYTLDSLDVIAHLAGLKIIKSNQLVSGNIPRLQVLLKKYTTRHDIIRKINPCADILVIDRFTQYTEHQKNLYNLIISSLKDNKVVNLWGVGGDFYNLITSYSDLIQYIESKNILLYDYSLANHQFLGQKILSSTVLKDSELEVILTPIYDPTRERMKKISRNWSSIIIDPYE